MNIIKKNKLNFDNKDIYLLEIFDKSILLNDGYHGIMLYNFDLELISSLPLKSNISIYSVFKKCDETELILYCPDDQKVVHCNLKQNKKSVMNISEIKETLSPMYYWDDQEIIIITYEGTWYKINLNYKYIEKTSYELKKIGQYQVDEFNKEVKKHKLVYQIDSCKKSFIYKNSSNHFVFYNFNLGIKEMVNDPGIPFHDVIYENGFFGFISEESIMVIHSKTDDSYLIKPESTIEIFLRARFIERVQKLFLIALVSDKSNNLKNSIVEYELSAN